MNYSILIIIIICLFYIYNTMSKTTIEGYDEKITNATFENCARFCKSTAQCAGFDYKNNQCYPSMTPILGKPGNSLFKDEYNQKFSRCNKAFTIQEPMKEEANTVKRPNGTFICHNLQNSEDKNIESLIKDNDGSKIYAFHNRDYIEVLDGETPPAYDDYDIIEHKWKDRNGFDKNSIDWNDIKHLYVVNKPSIINEETIKNDIKNNQPITGYKITNEFNNGSYLHKFQCVDDVEFKNCIGYCNNSDDCIGVEFNPHYEEIIEQDGKKYIKYRKNLCCPKRTIGDYQTRPAKFKQGKFYYKQKIDVNNVHNNTMLLL
jgi:hypothetical protein